MAERYTPKIQEDVIAQALRLYGPRREGRIGGVETTLPCADDVLVAAFGNRTPEYYAHLNELVGRLRPRCEICSGPIPPRKGKGTGNQRYCGSDVCAAEAKARQYRGAAA